MTNIFSSSNLIMDLHVLLVSFACFLSLSGYRVVGFNLKLSKQEDLELERQLKALNKPPIKTIYTDHGDIYDCINFYQQPAFDHPLLKNHTYSLEMENPPNEAEDKDYSKFIPDFGLKGETCPVGTVIIKRLTKEDLLREKIASSTKMGENGINVHYAGMMTKVGPKRYAGAGAHITIYNPKVVTPSRQYSAARVVLANGLLDRIAVGWRVDPFLHRDSYTHFYIRTDAPQSHCFGTRCPGFVVTSRKVPMEGIFKHTTVKGGMRYEVQVDIVRDKDGNWKLRIGPYDKIEVGHWPEKIFSRTGLAELASVVEWGGEVYGTPFSHKPPMGIGSFPNKDITQSSYMTNLVYRNEHVAKVDAQDLQPHADREDEYRVIDVPNMKRAGHIIFYGGPGGQWKK